MTSKRPHFLAFHPGVLQQRVGKETTLCCFSPDGLPQKIGAETQHGITRGHTLLLARRWLAKRRLVLKRGMAQ